MRAGDAASVAGLSGQLGYPATTEEMAQRFAGIATDPNHAVYVAELSDERIAGWVHLYAWRLLVGDRRAEIWGLVVDATHRGKGIGGRLMSEAEAWAEAKGCRTVTLRSNIVREEAHAFYKRLGYRRLKTQHVFGKNLPEVK
jgi:GNAT superfamily N-acetyltransferase